MVVEGSRIQRRRDQQVQSNAGNRTSSTWRRFYMHGERAIIGSASVLTFLIVWEAAFRFQWVNPLFISSPIQVILAMRSVFTSMEFHVDVYTSSIEFVIGYLMAIALGVPLGLATGRSRRLYYVMSPFIHTLNTVPRITLLPIIIIWFGIGIWSKILVVFLGALIPILISTYAGVRTSEERFMRVARSFNASPGRIFRTIVLPGTVPFIFTGMKYGTGRALLGVIVGELYAATAGVGYFIASAGNAFQTDKMLVGLAVVVAAGLIAMEVLNRIERRFDRWRPSVGSE
jgi:ABC-type nitrate/sulfonate/bicarbonate transport system permease component